MANDVVRRSRARILLPLVLLLVVVLFCLLFVRPSTASTGPARSRCTTRAAR